MDKSPTKEKKQMDEPITSRDQSYYAISPEISDNDDGKNYPLFVNCAGEASFKRKIKNDNKRGRNDYYLMYMQSGTMDLTVGGDRYCFTAGQLVCMPPHTPYAYDNAHYDERVRYYWIHFTGKNAKEIVAGCGLTLSKVTTAGLHEDADELMEGLFSEFRNRQSNFHFAVSLKTQYILMQLARYSEALCGEKSPLDASIRYIHEHIKGNLSVSYLANMEFLSVSRYREIFRKITGFSPSEYICRQRIHLACDMLEQGVSLSRAAELSGYTDRLYFQRVFKKVMGITPGEYRNRYQ